MEPMDARRTIAPATGVAAGDRLPRLLRAQLTPIEREMFDLGYLDPTASDFGVNPVTVSVSSARSAEDADAPMVTFYAHPAEPAPGPVDVARLYQWLEPNNHRYEPLPGQLFVPSRSAARRTRGRLRSGPACRCRAQTQPRSCRLASAAPAVPRSFPQTRAQRATPGSSSRSLRSQPARLESSPPLRCRGQSAEPSASCLEMP